MKLHWRFGIIAGIFLAVFTLYPQFKMLYLRGNDWQGHYAYNDIDEVAYASYIRALIDGRPRKNDPYTGHDDSPENPQPESLFSIQFAAPYTIALPSRVLGVPVTWAMTISGALAGFLTALAIFWLVGRITGDSWFAMAGSLVVLCGGALAAGEGAIGEILSDQGFSYPYFPGFRRYIPAMAFPAFFALCGLVWRLLTTEDEKKRLIFAALGWVCFAYTVFSYFYVWTTAAAWLGCLAILWLIVRPDGVWKDIKMLAVLAAGCLAALIPYAYLLSKRSQTMDDVQLLVLTHAPDLTRFPEYISYVVLLMLAAGILMKAIGLRDRSTVFALSLALTPLIIFNQQIITGRSLQPIHYQVFIGNYVAGLALIVTIGILLQKAAAAKPLAFKIAFSCLALLAIFWGFVECHYTVRVLDDANVDRDAYLPLARRLGEFAKDDPHPNQSTVLVFGNMLIADDLPTVAPQNVLWARHQHVFAGLSWQESKERYYKYAYYQNVDEKGLDYLIKNDFAVMIALFGWGRHTDRLSVEAKPLTYGEVAEEARRYGEYRKNFSLREATDPELKYVVIPVGWKFDLTNLDKWYERDAGEVIGDYALYKVKLRR
jgi:hypothetical protein